MEKRLLTNNEIENILDFIELKKGIPIETAVSIKNAQYKKLEKQLKGQYVYPKIIPELKKTMKKMYQDSLITPGESVGIMCAQSIGEKQTQLTLNSFHKAGQSEKAITAGVPRFQELLYATKNPKLPSCKIYFKDNNSSVELLRKKIGHKIVSLTLKNLSISVEIIKDKKTEQWYESFKLLYGNNFTKYPNCISVKINKKIIFEYKLTLKEIADSITEEYSDITCVFSPLSVGQIDIFVDTSEITIAENTEEENKILFVNTENAPEIYLEEVVWPQLESLQICGVSGITDIYYGKEENEWVVETDGNNFKEILALPIVDMSRIVCNDVWNIYEVLGIEAARQFLIEEFMSIMNDINISHVKLIAERMTQSGTISSISRYTMRKDESGPFGKASFEETMDNFLKAAASGDIEPTNGVSASIICGKRANIGTGMMKLKINIDKLPFEVPIIKDNVV